MRDPSHEEMTEPLVLVGLKGSDIELIEGKQWGTELTRATFEGATWAFRLDGTFLFTPSPLAQVRMDLYPIPGTYSMARNVITLQGEKTSSLVGNNLNIRNSASLNGVIRLGGKTTALEVVHIIVSNTNLHEKGGETRKVAKITQELSQHPAKEPTTEIAGIQVPTLFRITLEGSLEEQAFSPLPGTLRILPRHPKDRNPFLVDLSTDADRVNGAISWTSFVPTQSKQGELYSRIQVKRGQVSLNVKPVSQFGVGITWFTFEQRASTSQYRNLLADILVGATATGGNFTFSIQGDRVSGNIIAQGRTDMGGDSIYRAQLSGQRQDF